jgi:pimeloyl-ACP methyl ester carboxylesterase
VTRPRLPLLHHTVHRSHPAADWVVLVHGAGVTSEVWEHQIEAYRERYNLLLPDLRGHGGSAGLEGRRDRQPYTWESVSRDVLDLMDHYGINSAHMVGVSMGCIVIRTLAGMAPARVRSMVLSGAIARLNLLARVLITFAHLLKHLAPHMWLYRVNAWIVLPLWGHRESRRMVVRQARRMPRREFLRWLQTTHGLPDRLRRFEVDDPGIPTLLVMGDQDHMFLPGARAVAANQPGGELHVIDDCGHVCTVQRPEEFNRVSLAFLNAV